MSTSASPVQRFADLHTALYAKFLKYNLSLQAVNAGASAACLNPEQAMVVTYLRLSSEAQTVQRMIGLKRSEIDLRRHPVIELRLTSDHLTLELVLSPDAWWDQRNLLGKLSVRRYRDEFRDLIRNLDPETALGYWHGVRLTDEHLTAKHLHSQRVFDAWMATHTHAGDVLRIGKWYDADALNSAETLPELFSHAQNLYAIYRFMAWTGRNDYQSFYERENEGLV